MPDHKLETRCWKGYRMGLTARNRRCNCTVVAKYVSVMLLPTRPCDFGFSNAMR